jgi:hypothetical protein
MNEIPQIQLIGVSVAFSIAFFVLLYVIHRLFKVELKGDWMLVSVAAFPFLAYATINILSADIFKKEIGLSFGLVNVQLIKDPSTTERPELRFDSEVKPEARHGPKESGMEVQDVIAKARRKKLTALLVDSGKYKIDLSLVDKYASKSGYLFKHVVFVKGKKFLGYATPQDIDWYMQSEKFDKGENFYTHLRKIPVQNDFIYDTTSERETLKIMESRGIDTMAVLDSKTGTYKGLANRQQIAESMLQQLFKQIEKIKPTDGKGHESEYVYTLKAIQREIRQLNRTQSQVLGLLQASPKKRQEGEMGSFESHRELIEQQFVPGSR